MMHVTDEERCQEIRPRTVLESVRCAYARGHRGEHAAGYEIGAETWGAIEPTRCGDCAVEPGQPHLAGCDVERCSWCGEQWIQCGHSRTKKHDPLFARWSGFWPGRLEARAMGIDLNTFHERGLPAVLFVKPQRALDVPADR